MAEKQERTGAARYRGRAARLVDLVDYQGDSVVSQQIIHAAGGTVTLFAFDEGQNLSEHTTPFDALAQVLDGEAEIVIAGKRANLKEGDFIVMPANEPHAVKAVTRFKMLLTMVKP